MIIALLGLQFYNSWTKPAAMGWNRLGEILTMFPSALQIGDAAVIARNVAFAYKGRPLDVKTIGRG